MSPIQGRGAELCPKNRFKVLIRPLKARLKVLLKILIRLLKARLKVLLKALIRLLKARLKVLPKALNRLGSSTPPFPTLAPCGSQQCTRTSVET